MKKRTKLEAAEGMAGEGRRRSQDWMTGTGVEVGIWQGWKTGSCGEHTADVGGVLLPGMELQHF